MKRFEALFTSADDWQNNACLNWSGNPIKLYAIGYKKAGDHLVNRMVEIAQDQDVVVYPVCFLYRQYLELRLKEIIREGRILLEEGHGFPKHHRLMDLWPTVKGIVHRVWPEDEALPDFDHVDHVISQFSQLDPDSFTFRYPTDKEGNNLVAGVRHINIRHLAEFVGKTATILDSISFGISVYRDFQDEMRSISY